MNLIAMKFSYPFKIPGPWSQLILCPDMGWHIIKEREESPVQQWNLESLSNWLEGSKNISNISFAYDERSKIDLQ